MRDRRYEFDGWTRNGVRSRARRFDSGQSGQRYVAAECRELGAVCSEGRSPGRGRWLRYVWAKEELIWSAPAERSDDGALDLVVSSFVLSDQSKAPPLSAHSKLAAHSQPALNSSETRVSRSSHLRR